MCIFAVITSLNIHEIICRYVSQKTPSKSVKYIREQPKRYDWGIFKSILTILLKKKENKRKLVAINFLL